MQNRDCEIRLSVSKLDAASPDCIGEAVFGIGFKYQARVVRIDEPGKPGIQLYKVSFKDTLYNGTASASGSGLTVNPFVFGSTTSFDGLIIRAAPKYIDAATVEFTVSASTIDILYSFVYACSSTNVFHRRIATEMRDMLLRDIILRHDFSTPLLLTRKRKADTEAKAED